MAETRVIITAERAQAVQEFQRFQAEASQALNQIGRGGSQLDRVTMSARQTAAALRQVPAQFTDIVVSLQAGQNPLTVLLQQGGQLRDMFGSTGAAARALGGYALSLINPYTVLAAGTAAVALAYYKGSKEADAFTRSIALSGNAAGVSKGQLADMARGIRAAGETQSSGAGALAALVETGKVANENLQAFALTAVRSEKVIGIAVGDTVKEFQEIGKSPVEASMRLNERYNYLTAAVYEQMRALERRGEIDAAAEIGQKAYAAAMGERIVAVKAGLGSLERAWSSVRGVAARAWDAMLDIGREDSLDQKIAEVKKKLVNLKLEQMSYAGSAVENRPRQATQKAELEQQLATLQNEKKSNAEKGAGVALEQARIKWLQDGEKYLTRQQQLEGAVAKARAEGAAAGKSEQEITERIAQVTKSYGDIANDSINGQIETIKRRGTVDETIARRAMDLLVSRHKQGLVSERDYIAQVTQLDLAAFDRQKARIQEELALTAKKQNSEKDQAALRGQLADLDAQKASRRAQGVNQLDELEAEYARKAAENYANLIDKRDDVVRKISDEVIAQRDANDQIGLTKDGIAKLTAARLEERAALADQNAELALTTDFSGRLSESYRVEAARLRELAAARLSGAAKEAVSDKFSAKDLEDYLDPTKAKAFGDSLRDAFGGAGDSLIKLRATLEDYGAAQATVERARAAAAVAYGNDSAKLAAANITISRKEAQARAAAYGDMAGAAKGFFSQNTAGYKVLAATEKAFRLYELTMAAETMAKKLLYKGSEVAANSALNATKLAGEAATSAASTTLAGTEASAWGITAVVKALASLPFPFNLAAGAATLAAVIAIGAKMTGGVGGGGGVSAADMQKAQGTGSVFGDGSAKSDSIRRSIEQLQENSDSMLPINQDMLTALRNIESAMGGLTNLVVRTTGLTDGTNMGIAEGTVSNVSGAAGNFMTHLNRALAGIFHGDQLTKALFGKTTQTIIDSGLQYGGSIRDLQAGNGFQQYASIDTTKKSLFGLSKSTSNRVEVQGLNDELSHQFGLIFTNLDKSLQAASIAIGGSAADVAKVLDTLTLESTKISLKGLKGDELTDALNSVISKTMDEISMAVFPQFEDFRRVGEGYAETVLRLAGDYAKVDAILKSVGATFGATGAQSIAARERLIELTGGIDQLASQTSAFADNFLTEAERLAPVQKYVTDQLAEMGLQSLDTRDKFKAYVLGMMNSGALATEKGAEEVARLLALSDAFAQTHAATEDLTKSEQAIADERKDLQSQLDQLTLSSVELYNKQRLAIDASNRALADQVQALTRFNTAQDAAKSAYENERSALKSLIDQRNQEVEATKKLLDSLKLSDKSILSPEAKYFEAQRQFDAAAPGEAKNAAAQALLDASRAYNGSSEAYARDFAKVQAVLTTQVASQRAAASIAQQQLAALDKLAGDLLGVDATVDTLTQAVRDFQKTTLELGAAMVALSAANAAAGKPDTGNLSGKGRATIENTIAGLYRDLLGREAEAAGLKFWADAAAGGTSYDTIVQGFKNSDEYKRLHPTPHARGGIADGWSLVGEEGPEVVNFTNPGRVYTASETRQAIGGANPAEQQKQAAAIARQNSLVEQQNALLEKQNALLEDIAGSMATGADMRNMRQYVGVALAQAVRA